MGSSYRRISFEMANVRGVSLVIQAIADHGVDLTDQFGRD
jgi:hypothetical protein